MEADEVVIGAASMFDTIILLTEPVERPVLASVLLRHNPDLTIIAAGSAADLAAMEPARLRRARLIAFTTPVIVSRRTLDHLGFGAYNFHPGPPLYPGWAPAHFALYDEASEFGVTLHGMVERVDAGPIVDAELFEIPDAISVRDLEEIAYARLARMFWRHAAALAVQCEALAASSIGWGESRSSRRRYQALCDIPVTIEPDELLRRIKVFGSSHHRIAPTINLHGIAFRAVLPDPAQSRAQWAAGAMLCVVGG